MFAIDILQKDLSSYILSPIIGLSLLALFAGVIISMRQNRKLQSQRAVYYAAAPAGGALAAVPEKHSTPDASAAPLRQVNMLAPNPAELQLLHSINHCLPAGITTLNGLRASDLLQWEGGSAPSASLSRERIDCVLCDTFSGKPTGIILITDTRSNDPLLSSTLAATGLPVLHLEARRHWTPAQLAYMLQEGLGLNAGAPA